MNFLSTFVFAVFCLICKYDASAETLILDDDKDFAFAKEVNKRFHTPDFLVVTFTPKEELLSKESLSTINRLSSKFLVLDSIDSVISILNVPLLQSSNKPIKELLEKNTYSKR